jgi:hypothetical protein
MPPGALTGARQPWQVIGTARSSSPLPIRLPKFETCRNTSPAIPTPHTFDLHNHRASREALQATTMKP